MFNLYHVFDSRGESERYCRLRLKELTGRIKRLKIQVPFKLNGGKNKYTADFVYYDVVLGRDIIEDYKGGYQSDDFNKRWAWMKKQYPKYVYKISNFNDGREK